MSDRLKEEARKELARRELVKIHKPQRESLYEFLQHFREHEKKKKLDPNRHLELICKKLEDVFYGRTKRLIINIPPRSLKTETVSIAFPAWCMWHHQDIKFMDISYASGVAEDNSDACRAMYNSVTYKSMFPYSSPISKTQDTKKFRKNEKGGQYYAAWSTGTITGKGCDIMIIDDPLKPDDAMSETVRPSVNNNYHDTLKSRLNDPKDGAIVIIMQRLHDDDLCWHLIELEENGIGEKREKLVIPAIAEAEDEYRKPWQSFFEKRFPVDILHTMRQEKPIRFSCQYQQNPVNKETQEFHQEWFRYHGTETIPTPHYWRVFTTCDPAFKTKQHNDNTCIMTAKFIDDKMYILEYTVWKFSADVLMDKIIYHIKKRQPEKVGIEAFQAQSMISQFLKNELQKQRIYTNIEEITQSWDKNTKIRKLVPLYRSWLIYHKIGMDELERELERFPRGKHDDIIDAEQMLYDLYQLQPNTVNSQTDFVMKWDSEWRPIISSRR